MGVVFTEFLRIGDDELVDEGGVGGEGEDGLDEEWLALFEGCHKGWVMRRAGKGWEIYGFYCVVWYLGRFEYC